MSNPILKIITTGDGSHSLHREDLNETYHSFHGAKGESEQVFIKCGLEYWKEQYSDRSPKIFEVGLGTGLNALLAHEWSYANKIAVDYHSIEPIPVPPEVYQSLNYGQQDKKNSEVFLQIHNAEWEHSVELSEHFTLNKYKTTLENFSTEVKHDIIFFDAFAPSKQPEVWSLENIQKCYAILVEGGILTTYCAQGQFKRNLKSAGFEVEILPGAMGKKEMVRAHKS